MDNNTKITYYFGAGASAEALPLVKSLTINGKKYQGLSASFVELSDELTNQKTNVSYKELLQTHIDYLRIMSQKSTEFGTIDTYAKYLFLTDQDELTNLKNSLIFFFLYQQLYKRKTDNRALIFLTTILSSKLLFPQNLKFVTWNYDFQVEIAALNFQKESFQDFNLVHKRTPSLFNYYPPTGNIFDNAEYSFIHLNGIAGSYRKENNTINNILHEYKEFENLEQFLEVFKKIIEGNQLLRFAWETPVEKNRAILYAKEAIINTTHLVIIGYSFPFFNREIDNEIFKILVETNSLKKIYFQDPIRDGSFLKNQFNLPESIIIEPVPDTTNYFIPLEF